MKTHSHSMLLSVSQAFGQNSLCLLEKLKHGTGVYFAYFKMGYLLDSTIQESFLLNQVKQASLALATAPMTLRHRQSTRDVIREETNHCKPFE